MAQKKSELRTFDGGINADDTYPLIKPNELVNALNATAFNNYNQSSQYQGSISPLYSASPIFAINTILIADGGSHILLNVFSDEHSQSVFWFYYSSLGKHKIIRSKENVGSFVPTASVVLYDSYVIDGLGWTSDMYMSIRMFGNLLIFADNTHDTRYIDVTKTYTVGSISQSELSLITAPFQSPLFAERVTDSAVYSPVAQLGSFQFTIRYSNSVGFTSVLAPYSDTMFPVRETAIEIAANSGNAIDAKLNFFTKVPSDWNTIDFIVRNYVDNTFFIYRSLYSNVATDIAEVAAHNAGTTPLTARFKGKTLSALDSNSSAKQFESIPQKTAHIEISNDRLLLANNTLGYDPPTEAPSGLTITPTTVVADTPAQTISRVYLIVTKNYDVAEEEYPIYGGLFTFYDGKIWGLPREYAKLRFNGSTILALDARPNSVFPYLPPQVIYKDALIEIPDYTAGTVAGSSPNPFGRWATLSDGSNNGFNLAEPGLYFYNDVFAKYVWYMHELGYLINASGVASGDWRIDPIVGGGYTGFSSFGQAKSIAIVDSPKDITSVGSATNVFLPNSTISLGVRFYDEYMRSCGNVKIQDYTFDDYNPFTRTLTEKIKVDITGTPLAPEWAKFFAITLTKNNLCSNFINFAPNCIKVARTDDDGVTYVTSDWFNNIKNDDLFGIAIPLDSLKNSNQGYSFAQGDFMRLSFVLGAPISYTGTQVYSAQIIGVIDGHCIISPPKSSSSLAFLGQMSSQYNKINSPYYDPLDLSPISDEPSLMVAQFRQRLCYATIYQQPQVNEVPYEVASFGYCQNLGAGNQIVKFFNGTSTSTDTLIYGDCHTQKRTSKVGSFVGLSQTTNESTQSLFWLGNYGRIAPFDIIGQQILINEVRWGNTGSAQSNYNGLCVFDASDYKLVNYNSGEINMLQGQIGSKGVNDALLIVCANNGYYTLLGQSILRSTSNVPTVSQSSIFIDNLNEMDGKPATSSPRSFAVINGKVLWVDALNRKVWMFDDGNVIPVSSFKASRVFELLLKTAYGTGYSSRVSGGVNRLTGEYMVSIPIEDEVSRANLPTTTIEYPIDFYYAKNYTWVFNIMQQKWTYIIPSSKQYFNLNNNVYSWNAGASSASREFIESESTDNNSMIVIPFNSDYPAIKSPLAIKLDASRPPDETWIQADTNSRFDLANTGTGSTMVANVTDWIYRESTWQCAILRDRMSQGGNMTNWNEKGLTGSRIKGKNISVVMVWYMTTGRFTATSCELVYSL